MPPAEVELPSLNSSRSVTSSVQANSNANLMLSSPKVDLKVEPKREPPPPDHPSSFIGTLPTQLVPQSQEITKDVEPIETSVKETEKNRSKSPEKKTSSSQKTSSQQEGRGSQDERAVLEKIRTLLRQASKKSDSEMELNELRKLAAPKESPQVLQKLPSNQTIKRQSPSPPPPAQGSEDEENNGAEEEESDGANGEDEIIAEADVKEEDEEEDVEEDAMDIDAPPKKSAPQRRDLKRKRSDSDIDSPSEAAPHKQRIVKRSRLHLVRYLVALESSIPCLTLFAWVGKRGGPACERCTVLLIVYMRRRSMTFSL